MGLGRTKRSKENKKGKEIQKSADDLRLAQGQVLCTPKEKVRKKCWMIRQNLVSWKGGKNERDK